ncbi:MAG: hydroxymethylbilane synthase [Rhodospirillales bacterium]
MQNHPSHHHLRRADDRPLRIGTRASPLARAQTDAVAAALIAAWPDLAAGIEAPGIEASGIEIVALKTTGDRVLDRPLADVGGKGLFTKELDEAMLDGRLDLAVHSTKDVPTWLPDGICLAAFLPRADPRDAFIARDAGSLAALPVGAVVGTASLRRQAQLCHARPDLRVVPLRGNIGTRLGKLLSGEVDATLLAVAGLHRLGLADRVTTILAAEDMLPAVGQGAIGITCRANDQRCLRLLAAINDGATELAMTTERAMLAALDGSCRTPIGGYARTDETGALLLNGLVASPDGSFLVAGQRRGTPAEAADLGRDLGRELRARAGPGLLDAD